MNLSEFEYAITLPMNPPLTHDDLIVSGVTRPTNAQLRHERL
jgi:hypothetical protein